MHYDEELMERIWDQHRPILLSFLAECWACRRASPSEFGLLMEKHIHACREVVRSIYCEVLKSHAKPAAQKALHKNGQSS